MGDWFNAAQAQYDSATPAYLEAGVCEDCGFEDCICDDEEDEDE